VKIFISLVLFVVGFNLRNYNHNIERSPSSLAELGDKTNIGYVGMVQGSVFKKVGSSLERVNKNDFLYEQDVLVSKDKSFAKLIMKDRSQFNLGSNSQLKLDKYEINSMSERNIVIDMIKGLLRSNIVNKNKKGFINVKTPFAVMGVRGTEFINIVSENQVELVLLEGVVSVDYTVNDLSNYEVPVKTKLYIPNVGLPTTKEIEVQEFDYLNNNVLTNSGDFVSFYSDIQNTTVKVDDITPIDSTGVGTEAGQTIDQEVVTKERQEQFLDYKNTVVQVMQNKKEWNSLPIKDKEQLVEKQAEFLKQKSEELQQSNKAAVLITPDNKVVFFEDHPHLKEKLPKDRNGDIIGIRVDENLQPITKLNVSEVGLDKVKKLSETTIPVVGRDGNVDMIEVANLADETALNLPVGEDGLAVGVSMSVLDTTALEEVVPSEKNEIGRETASEKNINEISPTKMSKDVTQPVYDLMNNVK
jgi:hypothetical protein